MLPARVGKDSGAEGMRIGTDDYRETNQCPGIACSYLGSPGNYATSGVRNLTSKPRENRSPFNGAPAGDYLMNDAPLVVHDRSRADSF
jgi:hypothetical protein